MLWSNTWNNFFLSISDPFYIPLLCVLLNLFTFVKTLYNFYKVLFIGLVEIENVFSWKSYRFSSLLIYLLISGPLLFSRLSPACHTSALFSLALISCLLFFTLFYAEDTLTFSPLFLPLSLSSSLCMFTSFWYFLLLRLFFFFSGSSTVCFPVPLLIYQNSHHAYFRGLSAQPCGLILCKPLVWSCAELRRSRLGSCRKASATQSFMAV